MNVTTTEQVPFAFIKLDNVYAVLNDKIIRLEKYNDNQSILIAKFSPRGYIFFEEAYSLTFNAETESEARRFSFGINDYISSNGLLSM
jgi:hypothetical protein